MYTVQPNAYRNVNAANFAFYPFLQLNPYGVMDTIWYPHPLTMTIAFDSDCLFSVFKRETKLQLTLDVCVEISSQNFFRFFQNAEDKMAYFKIFRQNFSLFAISNLTGYQSGKFPSIFGFQNSYRDQDLFQNSCSTQSIKNT